MSGDSYTEVTSQSWGSRIGGAFKGILLGIILFFVAFPFLFWNEGRAVKTYKTLQEGGKTVIEVAADSVDAANEGKLIHVSGLANTEATLVDPDFGVSATALRLNRNVEMYQWKESSKSNTKKKLGGGTETVTEYTYSKAWSSRLVNAENFKKPEDHQNPDSMLFDSTEQIADQVDLGAFTLSPSLVERISEFEPLAVPGDTAVPAGLEDTAMLYKSGFYIGTNPASPQVGDLRVTFEVVKPLEVSVIAKQRGTTFAPYTTKTRGTLELLQTGVHTADEMIQMAQDSNKMLTWFLRLVGFILMLGGLNLVFKPLSVVADVLPIAGTIVGAGTGLISFLVAALGSLITIAIAWIVYRPLLGIALIVIAVGVAVALRGKLKSAKVAA